MSHFDENFKTDSDTYKVFKFYPIAISSVTSLDYILELVAMESNKELYNFKVQDFFNMDLNTFLYVEKKILNDMTKRAATASNVQKEVSKEFNSFGGLIK